MSNRSLAFNGQDRLTAANAPGVWGTAGFGYDPLDNLRSSVVGGRSTVLSYDDAGTRRLSMLNVNGSLIAQADAAFKLDQAHTSHIQPLARRESLESLCDPIGFIQLEPS